MRTPQHEIFNRLINSQGGEAITMISKCSDYTFHTGDDRIIFEAVKQCVSQGMQPHPVAIIRVMKEQKTFERRFVSMLSELTTTDMDNTLPFDSVCSQAREETNEYMIRNFTGNVLNSLNQGTFTLDGYLDQAKQLETSVTLESKQERTSKDVIKTLVTRHDKAKAGDITGLSLGFMNLSKYIILEPVDVMLVAARPAMGKSAFAVSCIKRLCFQQNLKVALFSLEMSTEQIHRRLVAELTDIGMNRQKEGRCSKTEIQQIEALTNKKELDNLTVFEGTHTNTDIRRKVTELKYTKGVDVFIVDYIQKIKPNKSSNSYEEITEVSGALKETCQNLKVPCIALAQLSRNSEQRGGDKRPVLSDLKGSGSLEQDASVVGFLHRPEYYGIMQDEEGNSNAGLGEFIIAKNREGECGLINFKVELGLSRWTEQNETIISNNSITQNIDFDTEETPF